MHDTPRELSGTSVSLPSRLKRKGSRVYVAKGGWGEVAINEFSVLDASGHRTDKLGRTLHTPGLDRHAKLTINVGHRRGAWWRAPT